MSSLTNINNNSSVINVGRTTPVSPGPQPADSSIPVVLASDQAPIPVVEQNKIQSEVALSLLGIPRSEVALGIFADVNTYDVNPVEWSLEPSIYTSGYGIKHLPEEAGALVESPKNEYAILTSKRFFRYQPGRVSAATFGVKCSISPKENYLTGEFNLNPAIRKYGIFDKYDGYYWETIADGEGDRFSVVRRTQSILKSNSLPFSNQLNGQSFDHGIAGKAADISGDDPNQYPNATEYIIDNRFTLAENAFNAAVQQGGTIGSYLFGLSAVDKAKCLRDMDLAIDAYVLDLQWGGNAHSIVNATTYGTALTQGTTKTSAESAVHTQLETALINGLNGLGESAAATKISTLTQWTKNAVVGTQPTSGQIEGANYGQRSKISTIFSIYPRYLGYLVSESMTYQNNNPDLSVDEVKNRCLRDVIYVVEGYAKDVEFGGDAATIFNAKNYYYDGIQVFSQTSGGVPAEIARHQFLKNLISSSSNITVTRSNLTNVNIPSVLTRFGLTSFKTRFDQLADLIIANFTTEYKGPMNFGRAAQYGHLVILRDNLLMMHAAIHDPSLLKSKKKIVVKIDTGNEILESSRESFVVGQHITFFGNAGGLVNGKTYKIVNVTGHKQNLIKISDPLATNPDAVINITSIGTGTQYIVSHVPFIFPSEYFIGENPGDTLTNYIRPDAAFPYLYTSDSQLPATAESLKIGFIDTAINTASNAANLKSQIDQLNLRYNNWIKQNVDPKYYAVYEYRVPRSRFSTDHLNGETNNVVYSDVATGESGRVYAGQPVLKDGSQLTNTSVWNIDFTKVVMLKIEFSWYGAVGALFLAYVPVSNGEARWVRVHHLRASNQLKIPSLGNATLPITYLVYGGGEIANLGIADDTDKGYGRFSNNIVKYGASYYIDGGDRGTVRLYSHSTLNTVDLFGMKYSLGNISTTSDNIGTFINVSGISNLPSDKIFFMNAKVITSSRQDQNVEIIWIDGNKIYLNKNLISTNGVSLIANRPSVIFGLKAKDNILNQEGIGVRNRVQVYPTKLSTANLGNFAVKMKVLKTPIYQDPVTTTGIFTLTSDFLVTANNNTLPTSSTNYLGNDQSVYGWFRANVGTVLSRLYRSGGNYYVSVLQTFEVPIILLSGISFLKEERFNFNGSSITGASEDSLTKERLSSVFVSTQVQCPIPKTGTEIATFFLKPGSDYFDLLGYFDYNKDYLSYPLTDQIESLFLVCENSQSSNTNPISEINASLTWEEQ